MPVPNKTIGTSIDVGTTLPVTVSESVHDTGGTWDVWYSYTAQAGDNEIGVFAYGDATVYKPGIDVYLGPPGSETIYLSFNQGTSFPNAPIQLPVTPGTTYYFNIRTNSATANPANLTLNLQRFADGGAARGSILVIDDTDGYPAALLDATDGHVLRFVQPVAAGENGGQLPTGEILLLNSANLGKPALYDAAFNVLASSINFQTGLSNNPVQTNKVDAFYVGDSTHGTSGHARIAKISKTGTILTTWQLAAANLKGLAPSPDESIIYIYGYSTIADTTIKRWDTGSSTFLSDLVAAVAGYEPARDLLVLADGSIIGGYEKSSPVDFFARRYSSAGATLNTYSGFSSLDVNFIADVRLFHALDDPTSFWVWTKQTSGLSQFTNIKASDGTILAQFSKPYYENGYFRGTPTASPSDRFGHSESCPGFLALVAVGTGTIVVNKTISGATDTTTSFPLTAGGGLSPASFSLVGGGSQTFSSVTPGSGYSIAETVPSGWGAATITVSNSSPSTNITVASGETVTVTVTNTPLTVGPSTPPSNPAPGGDCPCPPNSSGKTGNSPGPIGGGDGSASGTTTAGVNPTPIAGNNSPCSSSGGLPGSYATATTGETWAGQREPRLWLDCRFTDTSDTSVPLELALTPIPDGATDQDGYKAGTLTQISGISRALSNESGDYRGAQVTVTHNDAARQLRQILADPTKKYIHGAQANLKIRSETQRRAHGAPTYLFRGIVRAHDLQRRLGATITLEDYISSEFGPLGSRRVISDRKLTSGLFAGIPPENAGKPQPIILGYVGDKGATLPGTGASAEKGLVPVITVGSRTINGTAYTEFFLCGHAISGIDDLFAADPTHTMRIKIPSGDYGSAVLAPGKPGWPFPTKYADYTDTDTGKVHRVTTIFVETSSDYAQAHLSGQINIAANVCGAEETGDGTGRVISGLFYQLQFLLDNFILRRPGYYTGLYPGAPQWDDGTYLTQSASFAAMQALTATWIGGEGYIGSLVINDAPLNKEIVKLYAVTGHFNYGWSKGWQFFVSVPDDTASLTGLTTLREPSQIRAGAAPAFSTDQIENPIAFNYAYDWDKSKWYGVQQIVRDDTAITREGGERPITIDCKATNHLPTAQDAMARRLLWNKYPRPVVPVDTPIDGLDLETGQMVKVTSQDGLGSGYVDAVMRLVSLDNYDAKTNRMQWTAYDMTDIARSVSVFDTAVFDTATFV